VGGLIVTDARLPIAEAYFTKYYSYLSKYFEIAVVFGGEEAKRQFYADQNMNPDGSTK
jgi:hypothetical protein